MGKINYQDTDLDKLFHGFILVLFGLAIGLIIFTIGFLIYTVVHKEIKTIKVLDRYWIYTINVGHSETSTETECGFDYNNDWGCRTVTDTEWITTCKQSRQGREIPSIPPEVLCQDRSRKTSVDYYVKYSNNDAENIALFNAEFWDDLTPHTRVTVETNYNNRIIRIIK